MIGILVVSHGELAEALVSSAQMPIPVIPATYSESFRPAVPEDSGHPVGAERRWS